MVEYGNAVGQGSGMGGSGGGGGSTDVGVDIGNFVSDAAHKISTLPPEMLILIVVGIFAGLLILRRAF